MTLYSQYSTQWDSFAHIGSLFDADDDGTAEAVYYNGNRAGEHIKGPDDPDTEKLHASGAVLDGFDDRILKWITDSGLVAIIPDNMAIEDPHGYGAAQGGCSRLPIHRHCLFRLGVHLGEIWYLSELANALASRGRSRFPLTAPPLRLPGAVGSPVTPVATI